MASSDEPIRIAVLAGLAFGGIYIFNAAHQPDSWVHRYLFPQAPTAGGPSGLSTPLAQTQNANGSPQNGSSGPGNPNIHPAGSLPSQSTGSYQQLGYFDVHSNYYNDQRMYTVYHVPTSIDPSGYWVVPNS